MESLKNQEKTSDGRNYFVISKLFRFLAIVSGIFVGFVIFVYIFIIFDGRPHRSLLENKIFVDSFRVLCTSIVAYKSCHKAGVKKRGY